MIVISKNFCQSRSPTAASDDAEHKTKPGLVGLLMIMRK
jgi:hypothetical protein